MRFKKLSVVFSLIIWTAVIWAKTVSAEGNDANKVQEAVAKSGFQKNIEKLPTLINVFFAERLKDPNINPDRAAKVKEILSQAFNVQEMGNALRQDIDKELSPQELDAVLAWFNSPVGAKIAKYEETILANGNFNNQIEAMKSKIKQTPPASTRTEILQQLDKAALISESRLQMKVEVLKLMSKFSDLISGMPLLDDAEMSKLVKKKRTKLKASGKEEALVRSLVMYQAFSDSELLQYVNFYQTPAGHKFAVAATRSLTKIFGSSLQTLGDQLVKGLTGPQAP